MSGHLHLCLADCKRGVQMLAELHKARHCLGSVLPERILVQPQIMLLEFCRGTHLYAMCLE